MLAQNFKTPADLDLPNPEFEALVKVLGMLERGEIKSDHFDMSMIATLDAEHPVACLGGLGLRRKTLNCFWRPPGGTKTSARSIVFSCGPNVTREAGLTFCQGKPRLRSAII